MKFRKLLVVTAIGISLMAGGCSKDNEKPGKPRFKDGSPPTPTTENAAISLPEPIALSKGVASTAIENSILIAGDELNINEQLRLKSILTGYHGFDQYVFDAQIRDGGQIKKIYANTGRYDASSNRFIIKQKDIDESSKKSLVV